MKKLYRSVMLILLPSLIYLAFFFMNDPHNYWGFRADNPSGTLIDNMLAFRNGNYNGILLGDSRLPDFSETNVSELDRLSGLHYLNMSYPGASAEEMNLLFHWCEQEKPGTLQSVIVVTGWYNFNLVMRSDRVTSTNREIENPLAYAFNPNNISDCFSSLFRLRENTVTSVTDEQKALNFQTHLENVNFYLDLFDFDQETLDQLAEVCQYCNQHQIAVKIVLPPWWHEFYAQLRIRNLYETLDDYKAYLSCYAPVYDMEYESCALSYRYDDFSDNSHFHGETFEDFCDVILYNRLTFARLWEGGKLA